MDTQIYDKWLEMSKAAFVPFTRWNELATKTFDKATEQTLAVAKDYLDLGTKQLQIIGDVKDPQKWLAEESKLVSEFGQKMVGRAGEYFQVVKDTREAFTSWAETTAKSAAETVVPKTK